MKRPKALAALRRRRDYLRGCIERDHHNSWDLAEEVALTWALDELSGLDLARNDGVPDTRMLTEIAAVLRVDRGALIRWAGSQEIQS